MSRAFGNWRGWGGLRGKGCCIDHNLVGLALQQNGSAKDWGIKNKWNCNIRSKDHLPKAWEPPSWHGHHPIWPAPRIREHNSPDWGQRWEGRAPQCWQPQALDSQSTWPYVHQSSCWTRDGLPFGHDLLKLGQKTWQGPQSSEHDDKAAGTRTATIMSTQKIARKTRGRLTLDCNILTGLLVGWHWPQTLSGRA